MDPLFQLIQTTMAKQNGAESTRYCGGCHDPISLFSGTKNIFVKDLTGLGLKEAKDLVDGAPKPVKEGVAKAEADEVAAKLKDAGADVEVK